MDELCSASICYRNSKQTTLIIISTVLPNQPHERCKLPKSAASVAAYFPAGRGQPSSHLQHACGKTAGCPTSEQKCGVHAVLYVRMYCTYIYRLTTHTQFTVVMSPCSMQSVGLCPLHPSDKSDRQDDASHRIA